MRTGHRRAGARHPARQPGHESWVVPGGTHRRQVRRRPLIQRDQLVDLGAGQRAPPLDQRVEPPPVGLVCGHERIDIHEGRLLCLAGYPDAESTRIGARVDEVVIGEAVVLEVPFARFPSRLVALVIDLLVQFVLLFAAFVATAAGRPGWP